MDEPEIRKMVMEAVTSAVTETLIKGIAESVVKSVSMSINCAVDQAVTEAMSNYKHKCVFDLDEGQLKGVKKILDVVESAGHGDIRDGVEEIRANHTFVQSFRTRAEKIGGAFIIGIVTLLAGITLTAFGYGIKHLFTGGGGS